MSNSSGNQSDMAPIVTIDESYIQDFFNVKTETVVQNVEVPDDYFDALLTNNNVKPEAANRFNENSIVDDVDGEQLDQLFVSRSSTINTAVGISSESKKQQHHSPLRDRQLSRLAHRTHVDRGNASVAHRFSNLPSMLRPLFQQLLESNLKDLHQPTLIQYDADPPILESDVDINDESSLVILDETDNTDVAVNEQPDEVVFAETPENTQCVHKLPASEKTILKKFKKRNKNKLKELKQMFKKFDSSELAFERQTDEKFVKMQIAKLSIDNECATEVVKKEECSNYPILFPRKVKIRRALQALKKYKSKKMSERDFSFQRRAIFKKKTARQFYDNPMRSIKNMPFDFVSDSNVSQIGSHYNLQVLPHESAKLAAALDLNLTKLMRRYQVKSRQMHLLKNQCLPLNSFGMKLQLYDAITQCNENEIIQLTDELPARCYPTTSVYAQTDATPFPFCFDIMHRLNERDAVLYLMDAMTTKQLLALDDFAELLHTICENNTNIDDQTMSQRLLDIYVAGIL